MDDRDRFSRFFDQAERLLEEAHMEPDPYRADRLTEQAKVYADMAQTLSEHVV